MLGTQINADTSRKGLFCLLYNPQDRGWKIQKGLGVVSCEGDDLGQPLLHWMLIIDIKQKCCVREGWHPNPGYSLEIQIFLHELCVQVIPGTKANWFEVFHTLGELPHLDINL